PRFIAMYDEQGERSKLLGTLVIQLSTIGTLGLSAVLLVVGLADWLADSVISDRAVVPVLVILIVLTPIQALDELAVALFAVYARPSAIFFRRYLLTPALRLAVVALLWTSEGGPRFLAVGYVVTGVLGVALYGAMLVPLMRAKGLFGRSTDGPAAVHDAQGPRLSLPWAAVLGYSLPLMLSDLMYAVLNTSDVVLIGRYADSEAVAAYRAVLPAAK